MRSPVRLSESKKMLFLDPKVVNYLNDLDRKKIKHTREQERSLIIKAQAGDIKARNELVEANLKFVVACAKEFYGPKANLQDLIGCGNLGLIEAVKKYDLSTNSKLISCAVWWIRAELQNYIHANTLVHIPINKIREVEKVNSQIKKAEERGLYVSSEDSERACSIDFISAFNGMDTAMDLNILAENEEKFSNSICVRSENTLDSYNIFDNNDALHNVKKALRVLTPLEQEILAEKFGFFGDNEKSDDVLSLRFGINIFAIRKTIKRSIEKVKNNLKIEEYAAY